MLVISKAPIETYSNLTPEERKQRRKRQSRKAGDTIRRGYTRFKESGGLPVVENLLGLNYAPPADLAQKTPVDGDMGGKQLTDDQGKGNDQTAGVKKGLTTTQKWFVGLGVAAVLGVVGYYVYKQYAGKAGKAGKTGKVGKAGKPSASK